MGVREAGVKRTWPVKAAWIALIVVLVVSCETIARRVWEGDWIRAEATVLAVHDANIVQPWIFPSPRWKKTLLDVVFTVKGVRHEGRVEAPAKVRPLWLWVDASDPRRMTFRSPEALVGTARAYIYGFAAIVVMAVLVSRRRLPEAKETEPLLNTWRRRRLSREKSFTESLRYPGQDRERPGP